MVKIIFFLLFFLLSNIFFIKPVTAQVSQNSFVSIVNPVRGDDFWDMKNQKPIDALFGQMDMITKSNLQATWLIRFDALKNQEITNLLKNTNSLQEKGLFLEITPSWTTDAGVIYNQRSSWHSAGSIFLTGYSQEDRIKLIDKAFEDFKNIFGDYPKSVGAWWIDSYSLDYMQTKYGVTGAMIVADQYTTDDYQIWGQYWSSPYYPSKVNTLHPAQSNESKLPVVITQWAARDPVNGYGSGVLQSTLSVQPNDYIDFHNLDINYFEKLIDIYTKQPLNQVNQITIGIENSYDWNKYKDEYQKQINLLGLKSKGGQFQVFNMSNFSNWYLNKFNGVSPEQVIYAQDPLGSDKKVLWFMDPYYRAGWFYNREGSIIRDLRQYIENEEEICLKKQCNELNFATFETRVLDEVTYGTRWVIDEGKITDFKLGRVGQDIQINYKNEAGTNRMIRFLPRDIGVNERVYSIDGAILEVNTNQLNLTNQNINFFDQGSTNLNENILSKIIGGIGFILFIFVILFLPGLLITEKILKINGLFLGSFISLVVGIFTFTFYTYFVGFLHLQILMFLYPLLSLGMTLYFRKRIIDWFKQIKIVNLIRKNFLIIGVLVLGSLFQLIPVFRSGLDYGYGIGFWGPNNHDGIWHLALINQLLKGLPVENPIFSGNILQNYHYFYDLNVGGAYYLTKIPILDLVFRYFPLLLSLLLGLGTISLVKRIYDKKSAIIFSLFFVYFSGSFGWIVEYIKNKSLGGESAFWANQSISFNLNPPFAISLVLLIGLIIIFDYLKKNNYLSWIIFILFSASLLQFKSYAFILFGLGLGTIALWQILTKKSFKLFGIAFLVGLMGVLLYLPNLDIGKLLVLSQSGIFIFSPFWFVHSMLESQDRVGWGRLNLTRIVGYQEGNPLKIIYSETLGMFLFLFGNLGMRFISFGSLVKIKLIFKDQLLMFVFGICCFSFLIPMLFIQSGTPWNTIQFLYYLLFFTAVLSGIVLSYMFVNWNKLFILPITFVILVLTPINSIVTAQTYFGQNPHGFIPQEEYEGLTFLRSQPEGIVLTYPYEVLLKKKVKEPWPLFVYDSTAYVSAFSGKPVYVEDEMQNAILQVDEDEINNYKSRLVIANNFFETQNPSDKFLVKNSVKYIYLTKAQKIELDSEKLGVEKIFENDLVDIYKVK